MITTAYRLLEIIRNADYCVGWAKVAPPDARPAYRVDAAKHSRRSAAVGNDLYPTVVKLMRKLGWTLDDG